MAGPTFITDWILITQELRCFGETWHFTVSYKQNTTGARYSGAQLQALASQWYTSVATVLKPAVSSNVTFIQTTARDMTDNTGAEGIYVQPSGEVGTGATESTPLSVCATLSYRSATVGRTGRGRSYISGMPEGFVNSGIFVSGQVTQLALVASTIRLFNGSVDIGVIFVVASRRYSKLRTVLSTVVVSQVQNQMRRLPGHRRHKKTVVTPT